MEQEIIIDSKISKSPQYLRTFFVDNYYKPLNSMFIFSKMLINLEN
jgi:hypothetical protein